ncbi:hypothetical protein ACEQ8H_008841 [Pleosporales sp. CAS-2024a]
MADFAPYQDVPETRRALSPPPLTSPRASMDRTRSMTSPTTLSHNTYSYSQHDYFGAGNDAESPDEERAAPPWAAPSPNTPLHARDDISMFTTSLGWRLDYEAMFAYLFLPPVGGVILLVMEHQSDYVRFHAWQSSLLFSFVFVIHVIFSWSAWISWLLFVGDVGAVGWLSWKAYVDAGMLERYEVPFFGGLASSILDDE